jgi:hypothetical protein
MADFAGPRGRRRAAATPHHHPNATSHRCLRLHRLVAHLPFFLREKQMNHPIFNVTGNYTAEMHAASIRAGWRISVVIALGWIAFPFALQSLLHPGDIIRLHYALQGLHAPHDLQARQLIVGFAEAVLALAVLALVQLVGTVLFYRHAQVHGQVIATPALWPLAALLPGVLGNFAWLAGTGSFDFGGCVLGFTSAALTITAEILCEQLGRDFVLGPAAGLH